MYKCLDCTSESETTSFQYFYRALLRQHMEAFHNCVFDLDNLWELFKVKEAVQLLTSVVLKKFTNAWSAQKRKGLELRGARNPSTKLICRRFTSANLLLGNRMIISFLWTNSMRWHLDSGGCMLHCSFCDGPPLEWELEYDNFFCQHMERAHYVLSRKRKRDSNGEPRHVILRDPDK